MHGFPFESSLLYKVSLFLFHNHSPTSLVRVSAGAKMFSALRPISTEIQFQSLSHCVAVVFHVSGCYHCIALKLLKWSPTFKCPFLNISPQVVFVIVHPRLRNRSSATASASVENE